MLAGSGHSTPEGTAVVPLQPNCDTENTNPYSTSTVVNEPAAAWSP